MPASLIYCECVGVRGQTPHPLVYPPEAGGHGHLEEIPCSPFATGHFRALDQPLVPGTFLSTHFRNFMTVVSFRFIQHHKSSDSPISFMHDGYGKT